MGELIRVLLWSGVIFAFLFIIIIAKVKGD